MALKAAQEFNSEYQSNKLGGYQMIAKIVRKLKGGTWHYVRFNDGFGGAFRWTKTPDAQEKIIKTEVY